MQIFTNIINAGRFAYTFETDYPKVLDTNDSTSSKYSYKQVMIVMNLQPNLLIIERVYLLDNPIY